MKYERLTKRSTEYGVITICCACPFSYNVCTDDDREDGENVHCIEAVYDRLAELEDKIESGKMIDCPYGDKVWVIDYDEDVVSYICVGGNKDFLFLSPTVYAGKDITTPEDLCNYYAGCYMEDGDDADVVIFPRNKCFTDKFQAEAKAKQSG